MGNINISQPIRILHYMADINVASGTTNVLMNYYRNIDRSKVQFDFLYFDDAVVDYSKEIESYGGRCFKINKPGISKESIKQIKEFFVSHQNEWKAFHCHPVYASVMLGSIAKTAGIKTVIQHSHSSKFGDTKKSSIRNYVISRFNPLFVDYYFSCTEETAKLLGWKCFWKNKMQVLNNAIDCERFKFNQQKRDEVRSMFNIKEDTVVIGHSGRFSPEKNHKFLIDIFNEYHKMNPNSCLMLLGDGNEKENMKQQLSDFQILDKTIFLGRKDDPQTYLNAMDVFVFPSYFEGLSLALVEAQCIGLNIFTSKNIDPKTKLIEDFHMFSLSQSAKDVAKTLPMRLEERNRVQMYEQICNTNFNLKRESKKLEQFYIDLK